MPHTDTVPDTEFAAMAPDGVSIHAMRVRYQGILGSGASIARARSFAEAPLIDEGVEMLAEVRPNAIAYCFTSSSYALGPDGDSALKKRLETKSKGIPLTLTCLAAISALHAFGARRVALIHPPWFAEDIEQRGVDYFQQQGFEVVYHTRAPLRDTGLDIHPGPLYQWARANIPKQAEAVFFGGNGMRTVGMIQALEESLGRPVLTSNQVCLWESLRLANISARVVDYGQLLAKFSQSR